MARAAESASDLEYVGGVEVGDDLHGFLESKRPRVLIDFTHPSAALGNALHAVKHGASPVVGTTGIPADGIDELERACREAALGGIVAPNFSIGAVLMMHLAELAAPFFDAVEVIEMHHAGKADAPSGTALATARRLAARKSGGFARGEPRKTTLPGTRGGEEGGVSVHSVRLPGVVADQEVVFGLPVQMLDERAFDDVDLVLIATGADVSRTYAPIAVEAGALVVDNSSAWRMAQNVPLVVPEVNVEDIRESEGIIANPNCCAIPLTVALEPLRRAAGLSRVLVATYQS